MKSFALLVSCFLTTAAGYETMDSTLVRVRALQTMFDSFSHACTLFRESGEPGGGANESLKAAGVETLLRSSKVAPGTVLLDEDAYGVVLLCNDRVRKEVFSRAYARIRDPWMKSLTSSIPVVQSSLADAERTVARYESQKDEVNGKIAQFEARIEVVKNTLAPYLVEWRYLPVVIDPKQRLLKTLQSACNLGTDIEVTLNAFQAWKDDPNTDLGTGSHEYELFVTESAKTLALLRKQNMGGSYIQYDRRIRTARSAAAEIRVRLVEMLTFQIQLNSVSFDD